MQVSSHTNGATSLVLACRNGHFDAALYLIEKCHANIEQVGSVILNEKTIDGATPLWCAAAAGHLDIVKLLVKYKASINSVGKMDSTPLQEACSYGHFEIAKYLIQHGADIELANSQDDTCLMIACGKGHYEISKYLVECGADVNRKNVEGRTALHDCADSGSLDILKLLLENGAKFDTDSGGITPLLSAAASCQAEMVQYFIQEFDCTKYDKINALELLGATLIDANIDMVMALDCWRQAMFLRYENKEHPLEKPTVESPIESYINATEVRTFSQLEDLISHPDEMRMQALLVRDRILGPGHRDTVYYIGCSAGAFALNGNFHRCSQLFMYALDIQQKFHEPLNQNFRIILIAFANLFSYMVSEAERLPAASFYYILQVFERAVKAIESALDLSKKQQQDLNGTNQFHHTLIIVMHLIGLMCQMWPLLDKSEELQLKKSVYRLVQMKPRAQNGCTLLHLACSKDSSILGHRPVFTFPSSEVVDLLLAVGACPNALDLGNNTPLHIAAMNKPFPRTVFKALLNHGAHLDSRNLEKQTPLQLAHYAPNMIDLNPLSHINLQCLCAQVVQSNGIPYKGYVQKRLEDFIDVH